MYCSICMYLNKINHRKVESTQNIKMRCIFNLYLHTRKYQGVFCEQKRDFYEINNRKIKCVDKYQK